MYPESASFEFYMPEGWVGNYFDFTNLVSDEVKYWIDINENIFLTDYRQGVPKMSDKNTVTMLSEEFENAKTGEKVEGITIIIDGKLKQVMDIIRSRNKNYNNYTEILRDALFEGINNLTDKLKE